MPIAIPALDLGAVANANPPATSAIKRSFFMFSVTSQTSVIEPEVDVKVARLVHSFRRDRISDNRSHKYRVRFFRILPVRGARHRWFAVRPARQTRRLVRRQG